MTRRFLVAVPLAAAATAVIFLVMRAATVPPERPDIVTVRSGETESGARAPVAYEPKGLRLTRDPVLVYSVLPKYPHGCGNVRATVVLDLLVDANGLVSRVELVQASDACAVAAAKRAALRRRYLFALANGRRIDSRVRAKFVFAPPRGPPPRPSWRCLAGTARALLLTGREDGEPAPILRRVDFPPCGRGWGEVVLEYTVEVDGGVGDVEIVSATSECFANAARRAVTRWCYRPKVVNGRAVRSGRKRVKVQFVQEG